MSESGVLYIVATPIGNLSDVSQRAISVLADVDVIAAEDTRHSGKLMQHLNIDTKLVALHEHNETQKAKWFVEQLQSGKHVALISDAGTPLISDPGYHIVRIAREAGIKVSPIPGACAVIAALSAAGLATDKFQFCGFLPVKAVAKTKELESLKQRHCTSIYYEAPRRVVDTLTSMVEVLQHDRQIVLAKELTKNFETFVSGNSETVLSWLNEEPARTKGEFVLLIEPAKNDDDALPAESIHLLTLLMTELPLKKAAAIAAQHTGVKKNDLYKVGLELAGK
ncbi:MAG: 16S rRNA (cytidine(1402)-2'-O)-methyltransferase [Alteromonadaceae bacterium]|nr:16S rRNA (cytidine(1402)-2'-O)-methyltransferase [Alteromonadaceae bacterium]